MEFIVSGLGNSRIAAPHCADVLRDPLADMIDPGLGIPKLLGGQDSAFQPGFWDAIQADEFVCSVTRLRSWLQAVALLSIGEI